MKFKPIALTLIALSIASNYLLDDQKKRFKRQKTEYNVSRELLSTAQSDIANIKTKLEPFVGSNVKLNTLKNNLYKLSFDRVSLEKKYDVLIQSVQLPQNLIHAGQPVGNIATLNKTVIMMTVAYKDYDKAKAFIADLKENYALSITDMKINVKSINLTGYVFGAVEPQA